METYMFTCVSKIFKVCAIFLKNNFYVTRKYHEHTEIPCLSTDILKLF